MRLKLLYSTIVVLCLTITQVIGQGITVSGKVTSAEDGGGLPGVNVIIKGTTAGAVTDVEGNYKLNAPSGDAILVFSFVGYTNQEVPIQARTTVDVVLALDVSQLEEIVVTGSAVGKSKKTLSFAVGSIDQKLIESVPAPNLASGLQGKVAGLRVNSVGGQPGQGAFFQIRSATSISNGQQPLVIVDGVYMSASTLADLSAEDIERVEVLKGSAGASLYGSQAANGVIQIFTKRGKGLETGATQITYRGEWGFSKEAGRFDVNNFTNRPIISPGDPGHDPDDPSPQFGNRTLDVPSTLIPNLQDYQEQWLFRNGFFMTNSVTLQGRTEKTNFLTSYQRLDDEGIINFNDGYSRNAFRVNVDHVISDRFDIQVSSMWSNSEQDLQDAQSAANNSFWGGLLFLFPAFDLDQPNEEDGSLYNYDIDNTGFGTQNPLYDIHNISQTVDRTRILGNITVNYDITDWLQVNTSVGLDRSTNDYEHFIAKGFLSNLSSFGPIFTASGPILGSTTASGGISNGGGINYTNRINNSLISRVNLVAQKRLGDFNTAFRASYLYEQLTSDFNGAIGENLAVEEVRSLDNAQDNKFIFSQFQEIVANSFFLIADIDYQEKYIFSGLVRREGSSLFGPEERWSNYFRASAAYRITEDVTIGGFQELKIRASIGTAGVRPTFEQRFETFTLIDGNASKNTLGNNFLKPSQSTEIEVGINAAFLDAFNLEFTYSNTETEDQILLVPLSGAAGGFTGQWRNAGTLEADIIEVSLNTDFGRLFNLPSDFTWDLGINFDRVTQEVSKLDVPSYNTGPGFQQSTLFLIEEGVSFGTMTGEVFATSLDQLQGQINSGSPAQVDGEVGQPIDPSLYSINALGFVVLTSSMGQAGEVPYKLRDENGSPIVQKIGDINPDFRMGFANTIGYKGLSLYTLFDWKKGGDVYNLSKQWMMRDARHGDVARFNGVDANGNPDGSLAIAESFYGSDGLYNVLVSHSGFAEDAGFFMLREANLSYELPRTFLQGFLGGFIKEAKISFIGRNLFTITDYSGFHPDVSGAPVDENRLTNRFATNAAGSNDTNPSGDPSVFAVDNFAYPVAKTFSGSVQITF